MTFRVDAEALILILKFLNGMCDGLGWEGTPPAWRVRGACSASSRIRCPLPQRRRSCRRSARFLLFTSLKLVGRNFLIWIPWILIRSAYVDPGSGGAKWHPESLESERILYLKNMNGRAGLEA
jgi:hypothetical protein